MEATELDNQNCIFLIGIIGLSSKNNLNISELLDNADKAKRKGKACYIFA